MDEFTTTSDNLDQTDEDILNPTASDEALKAAGDGVAMCSYQTATYYGGMWCEVC
jgi:hypothetical protein